MKRAKYLLGILIGTFLILSGCGEKDNSDNTNANTEQSANLNETGFPIVEESITLDFMVGAHPATNDNYNDLFILNEYEEMTNIDINWEMVPLDTLGEKRNLAFGGGKLPDAFYSGRIPEADLVKYGSQGVLIPLNDLIEDYAPNFNEWLEEYPDVKDSLTMPDGNIYSFPMLMDPEFLSVRMGAKPFINKDLLEDLDMDVPETIDEFHDFLKAVKENGPDDVAPFGADDIGSLYSYLRGSFGLANQGSSVDLFDLDPETDELRFYPLSDEYRDLIEYMRTLYDEGLIEENIFSIDSAQYLDNLSAGKYGSTIWYSPAETVGNAGHDYIGMPALEGPDGDQLFTTFYDAVFEHSFAITEANEYPAETVRWLDYFYGDEGLQFFYMGVEGETYEINDEGEPEYIDDIINNEAGLSFEEAAKKYLVFPGGGYPSIANEAYFAGAENSEQGRAAADTLAPYLVEDPWTRLTHTEEETKKLSGFGADIEKYVGEIRDQFISGELPLNDKEWDKFVKEIEKMGLDDYIKIKQEALDRQLEK